MTFHLAQVLSGHGCFGKYLCKIAGREPTEECHECGCAVDTAQHTLADCPSWAVQRAALVAVVGQDLSLPAVVRAMAGSETSWDAIVSFCEDVMTQKEAAERLREDAVDSQPIRRRRVGRRRLAQDRRLPP
ncbi:jg20100 [Pararge aegeria aegeria]|uniref:Jg20100 protein n=1 Tax=Pararge aegeria aegeria TaxID=348720 RepID=A0A8S4QKE5_9NEOP|nr:jg20100 [Pararge aegeria aegeria]